MVSLKRLETQVLTEQMHQERDEALEQALAYWDVAVLVVPALRPTVQVGAQLGQCLFHARHNRRRFVQPFACRDASDPLAQRLSPLSRICL